jgi:hypothetical protein
MLFPLGGFESKCCSALCRVAIVREDCHAAIRPESVEKGFE